MNFLFKKRTKPKFLSVYIKSDGHLYLVPNSFNKDDLIVEADFYRDVPFETDDSQFLSIFKEVLSKCNRLKPIDLKDDSQLRPICKATGNKTYSRAVKGITFVHVQWDENKGYTITPTIKVKGQGYTHIEEKNIECNEENLIQCLRNSIQLASIHSE